MTALTETPTVDDDGLPSSLADSSTLVSFDDQREYHDAEAISSRRTHSRIARSVNSCRIGAALVAASQTKSRWQGKSNSGVNVCTPFKDRVKGKHREERQNNCCPSLDAASVAHWATCNNVVLRTLHRRRRHRHCHTTRRSLLFSSPMARARSICSAVSL